MNMACSNRAIKHTMFVFNFIFVITGVAILAVGASVKAHYYPYDTFLDGSYFSLPNMLIATGSFIFFISFLGCYGAIKENWITLMAFSVLMAIIFIFELSVGIAGYVLRDKTSNYIETKLYDTITKYEADISISKMWDAVQQDFECCGVVNSTDWETPFKTKLLPISCCPQTKGIIGAFYCNSNAPPVTESTKIDTTPSTEATTVSTTEQTTLSTTEATTVSTTEQTTLSTTEATTVSTTEQTTLSTTKADPAMNNENTALKTPVSDVKDGVFDTPTYPPSTTDPYATGCKNAFGNFVKKHAVDIGAVGITLAFLQLIGIFLSFHLARQLKNGYYST
ncbi:hypothetical protein NQ315_003756 [Exocentrus adspersus]|uniref:Tetraspanin n=1 Tax=Exocentrus adspersus TaxID=1586481 RepID=A0AAV8VHP3_9CUCU|nr:hypothetical protein NQ315_003756 [Exocentrus adspersus]